jgi:hypothetical protein
MSQALCTAYARGWNLATILMVCVIVFQAGDGFGFMPTSDYDGDLDFAAHEFAPPSCREGAKDSLGGADKHGRFWSCRVIYSLCRSNPLRG